MASFHLYGFFVGLGIVAGLLVIEKVQKKWSVVSGPRQLAGRQWSVVEIIPWFLVPSLIGARLYHVIDYWQYYSENSIEILYLWQGGMGIYGAVVGGVLGIWLFVKVKSQKLKVKSKRQRENFFLSILDLAAFGLPVGQAIGRLGNYFNQELYGLPTNLAWGIYIDSANRLPGYEQFSRFQPLFAYEAVWNLIIFITLITVINVIKKPKPGTFFFIYLGLYGFGRFWLEFLRINPWEIGGINIAQGISLGLVVIGLIGLIGRKNTLGKLGKLGEFG